jgi:hypothetical protein
VALRDVARVPLEPLPGEVVAELAEAELGALDQRRPVGDQAERLANAHVVERLQVRGHRDRHDLRAVADEDADVLLAQMLLRLRVRQLLDSVDLAGQQRVEARLGVGDRRDLHGVDVRQAVRPVVRVPLEEAAPSGLELVGHERARAHRLAEVLGAVLHHHERIEDEARREIRDRRVQRELELVRVHLAHRAQVERLHRRQGPVRLRGGDPAQGVHHVVGSERLAVVPDDALAELDRPLGRVLVRLERGRQAHLDAQVRPRMDEQVVQRQHAARVDRRDGEVRVERLRLAAADHPDS